MSDGSVAPHETESNIGDDDLRELFGSTLEVPSQQFGNCFSFLMNFQVCSENAIHLFAVFILQNKTFVHLPLTSSQDESVYEPTLPDTLVDPYALLEDEAWTEFASPVLPDGQTPSPTQSGLKDEPPLPDDSTRPSTELGLLNASPALPPTQLALPDDQTLPSTASCLPNASASRPTKPGVSGEPSKPGLLHAEARSPSEVPVGGGVDEKKAGSHHAGGPVPTPCRNQAATTMSKSTIVDPPASDKRQFIEKEIKPEDVPDASDRLAESPVAGTLRITEAAIYSRLKRVFTPSKRNGELKVSDAISKMWHSKGLGRDKIYKLFQSCGYCPDWVLLSHNSVGVALTALFGSYV